MSPSSVVHAASYREVLGRFVTGVTVVTAAHDETHHGMCVNSFASLSIEPPLVMFAAASTSTTWPHLRAAGCFAVNVLDEAQAGTARAFARSGADRFADTHFERSAHGHPVFPGSLAIIECELERTVLAGDHEIAICGVVSLTALTDGRPLAFYQSQFGSFDPATPTT